MENFEIAVLLQSYNKGIIGMPNYVSLEKFSKKINWIKIANQYKVKKKFKSIAQKLVKFRLLSDDGKSMSVLYLDKLGVDYILELMSSNPRRIANIQSKID